MSTAIVGEKNAANRVDRTTLSNCEEVRWQSLHLELAVDFDASTLTGTASMEVEVLKAGSNEFVLDTKDLKIQSVKVDGTDSEWEVDDTVGPFGQPLRIPVPSSKQTAGGRFDVTIGYSTSPEASACQWLPKEQTGGKKYPYLFTQCQAIHARSLLPCQDSPGAKVPYTAKITAPSWSQALMSAVIVGKTPSETSGMTVFEFKQEQAISSYLVALAVGELEERVIGPRSSVWSEPNMVEAVAYEFGQTEEFIKYAEEILKQEYVWGRYDILCLPPSFPYGGMVSVPRDAVRSCADISSCPSLCRRTRA
jgi:leukotriene-A4 hydrolase